MCGLIGAVRAKDTPFPVKIRDFMEKGLIVSSWRGREGTGIGIVDKEWRIGHVKSQLDSPTFLQTDQARWAIKELYDARVVLGHTRHSTIANSIAPWNSHPFHWSDNKNEILLTHNGHCSNAQYLTGKEFNHAVDSAHIAYAFLKNSEIKILQELMGFYALIWYNSKERSLKMARNNTRDFYYVYNKPKTILYYASEAEMLDFVLSREDVDADLSEFHEIKPEEILTFDLEAKTLANPVRTSFVEKKSSPHQARTEVTAQGGASTSQWSNSRGGTGRTGGNSVESREYPRGPLVNLGMTDPVGRAQRDDIIYVKVQDFSTFRRYDSRDGIIPDEQWGDIWGIRERESGSVVKIQGLQKSFIESCLDYIKDAIPVKVNSSHLCTVDEHGNVLTKDESYMSYTGMVSKVHASEEYNKRKRAEREATNRQIGLANVPVVSVGNQVAEALAKARKEGLEKVSTPEEGDGGPFVEPATGAPSSAQLVPGPGNNGLIPISDWMNMAAEGCFFCSGQILSSDVGNVSFYAFTPPPEDHGIDDTDYMIVCPTCREVFKEDKGKLVIGQEVKPNRGTLQ